MISCSLNQFILYQREVATFDPHSIIKGIFNLTLCLEYHQMSRDTLK